MRKIMEMYEKTNGRELSPERAKQLWNLQQALGLEDNDALWSVIIGLDHFHWLYEQVPKRIEEVSKETLERLKGAAAETIRASVEETKRNLSSAVVQVAEKTAQRAAARKSWQWFSAAYLVAFFLLFGTGYMGYQAGHSKGWGEGYEEARDESAAAAWANSKEGKLARQVAEKVDLGRLRQLVAWDLRAAMESVKWTWTRKGQLARKLSEKVDESSLKELVSWDLKVAMESVKWTWTPEGRAARSLSRVTNIKGLANCTLGENWKVSESSNGTRRGCFPYPSVGGDVSWWEIPVEEG